MKVVMTKMRLMIVPETDFETNVLSAYQNEQLNAFVKCAEMPTEMVGLVIEKKEAKCLKEKTK